MFIDELLSFVNEEKAWEFWLHKPTGKSWVDFRLSCMPQQIEKDLINNNVSEIEKSLMEGVNLHGVI